MIVEELEELLKLMAMVILESKKDIQKPCECLINLEQNNIKKQKFINLLLNENTQELK